MSSVFDLMAENNVTSGFKANRLNGKEKEWVQQMLDQDNQDGSCPWSSRGYREALRNINKPAGGITRKNLRRRGSPLTGADKAAQGVTSLETRRASRPARRQMQNKGGRPGVQRRLHPEGTLLKKIKKFHPLNGRKDETKNGRKEWKKKVENAWGHAWGGKKKRVRKICPQGAGKSLRRTVKMVRCFEESAKGRRFSTRLDR